MRANECKQKIYKHPSACVHMRAYMCVWVKLTVIFFAAFVFSQWPTRRDKNNNNNTRTLRHRYTNATTTKTNAKKPKTKTKHSETFDKDPKTSNSKNQPRACEQRNRSLLRQYLQMHTNVCVCVCVCIYVCIYIKHTIKVVYIHLCSQKQKTVYIDLCKNCSCSYTIWKLVKTTIEITLFNKIYLFFCFTWSFLSVYVSKINMFMHFSYSVKLYLSPLCDFSFPLEFCYTRV